MLQTLASVCRRWTAARLLPALVHVPHASTVFGFLAQMTNPTSLASLTRISLCPPLQTIDNPGALSRLWYALATFVVLFRDDEHSAPVTNAFAHSPWWEELLTVTRPSPGFHDAAAATLPRNLVDQAIHLVVAGGAVAFAEDLAYQRRASSTPACLVFTPHHRLGARVGSGLQAVGDEHGSPYGVVHTY